MADNAINVRLQSAYKTAADWSTLNPILKLGEVGYEIDTGGLFKIGDGDSTWNQLPYSNHRPLTNNDFDTIKLTVANQIVTGSGTAARDAGASANPRYFPTLWKYDTGRTAVDGDIITVKIPSVGGHSYGVQMSIDNGATYYPIALNGTAKLTTHFPANTYLTLIYEPTGVANGSYPATGANSTANITKVWRVLNYRDTDNDATGYYLRRIYPNLKAGSNKIFPYTIILQKPDGKWESLVKSSTTAASKAVNTNGFLLTPALLMYANATYNDDNNVGTYYIWSMYSGLIDHRYSFNTENNATNGTTGYKPVYLVGTIGTDGLFYLNTTKWWAQELPAAGAGTDGTIYWYIGDAYDYYRLTFVDTQKIYIYSNGRIREYSDFTQYAINAGNATNAAKVNGTAFGSASTMASGAFKSSSYAPTRNEVLAPIGNACSYSGSYGIAVGQNSTASKSYSFSAGSYTIAPRNNSAVFGLYNASTASSMTIFDIGVGNSNSERVSAFMADLRGGSIVSDLIFASKVSGNKLGDNFCGISGQPSIRHEYAVVNSWPAFLESDTSHMVTTSYDLVTTSMYALGVITPQRYSDAGSEVTLGNYMSRLRGIRDSFNTYSVPFTNSISGTGTVTGSVDITFPFTFYKQPIAIYISIGGNIQLTGESITDDFGGKSAAAIVDPQLHINGSYNVPATGATTASVAYRLRGFDSGTKTVKGNILILFD